MSLIRKVQLADGNGNYYESHQDTDGEYYLATAMIQAIHADPNNSNDSGDPSNGGINLTSENSYTFTGIGTSTLGVVGLQWSLKTDQNATVYIEQSLDNVNWDISDSFNYYYSKGGRGNTVQAVSSYWRIRVVLTGTTDTTYFRLQGVLCPIAEPLPRKLDTYGRLITSSAIEDAETGTHVDVEPLGSMKTVTPVRLVGTGFDGTTKDTNFWTETVANAGTVTQAGGITLSSGTNAAGSAKYTSVRKARKVPGSTNQFRAVARLTSDPVDGNIRRIGAYDTNDGFFFEISGTTFSVVARKGTSDANKISSGSFNGNYGSVVVIDTSLKRLVIDYTAVSAKFYIDDILLHTITSNTDSSTNTLTLPVTMENINTGSTTDSTFNVRFACIMRLGTISTQSAYGRITAAGTYNFKYGAGSLHRITLNNPGGTLITIYNDTAGTSNVMAIINSPAQANPVTLEYGIPFSNGLKVVSTGTWDATIIYE